MGQTASAVREDGERSAFLSHNALSLHRKSPPAPTCHSFSTNNEQVTKILFSGPSNISISPPGSSCRQSSSVAAIPCEPSKFFDAPEANEKAVALLEKNHLPEAMRVLRAALERDPDDPSLNANLGLCLARRNEFGAARELYQCAYKQLKQSSSERGGHVASAGLALAWCSQRVLLFEEAIELYQEVYQQLPGRHEILGFIAEAYRDLGRVPSAIATLEYLVQQCPKSVEARLKLAGLHGDRGTSESTESAVHV